MIILLLLLAVAGVSADIIIKPDFNFGLISPSSCDMDLRYSNSLNRLYVIANFSLDPKSLPKTTYHSLFLSKDLHLEQICISNKLCGMILADNLVPEHFVPDFPIPALLDSTSNALCYSFNLEPLLKEKKPIDFRLVYWVDMPALQANLGGQSTLLSSDYLWFPRNLIEASTLNLKVTTSDMYQVRCGDILNYSDTENIRTHEGSFADSPDKYFELKIFKS